jgi:hypothetical protein
MANPADTISKLTGTAPEVVPPGMYEARLDRVEIRDTKYGDRLRWVFVVPDAESGEEPEISVWSGLKTHRGTKAGELLEALGEKRPGKGEEVDLDALAGRWVRIVLKAGDTDDDFPKVVDVSPSKHKATPADDLGSAELDEAWAEADVR